MFPFNFLATTFRFKEEDLVNELEGLLAEFGEPSDNMHVVQTNISGLVYGSITKNPQDFIDFIRTKLKESPWEIRYLLRFIPIQQVTLTDIEAIKDMSIKMIRETITGRETIKILVEKRHTNLERMDIIDKIGPNLNLPVNLTNPDWILLVEIIGKYTGISVMKQNMIFSSMIEKRSAD